jgi:HAMP domain-containing protein
MSPESLTARWKAGLSTRLLAAQVLVVLTAALTAWLVAAAVGPALFHDHLQRAGVADRGREMLHAERAFRSTTVITFYAALFVALVAAALLSLYVTRRIGRSVAAVADAAAEVAGGAYDARVPPPGLGPEFDTLTAAFNQLAAGLESVETTRRRLLSDLGHEMRTPVATIDAYLEGLEDGVTRLDAQTTAMLRAQSQRLARLAEDVSAVSRAEERQVSLALPHDPGMEASSSRSPTRAKASPPSTCPTCSSGSTGSTPPVTANMEAPGSAWRSAQPRGEAGHQRPWLGQEPRSRPQQPGAGLDARERRTLRLRRGHPPVSRGTGRSRRPPGSSTWTAGPPAAPHHLIDEPRNPSGGACHASPSRALGECPHTKGRSPLPQGRWGHAGTHCAGPARNRRQCDMRGSPTVRSDSKEID